MVCVEVKLLLCLNLVLPELVNFYKTIQYNFMRDILSGYTS
jgi:hypothetical protein